MLRQAYGDATTGLMKCFMWFGRTTAHHISQKHAHRFFRLLQYCASRFCPPTSDRHSNVLLRHFEAFEGGDSVKVNGSVVREVLESS